MNHAERLDQFAHDKDIDIDDWPIAGHTAMCFKIEGKPCIVIDRSKIETDSERAVVLGHEIGHAETESFNDGTPGDIKNEYRANKWAFKNMLPLTDLESAMANCDGNMWEVAEELGFTEEFVRNAAKYYGLMS